MRQKKLEAKAKCKDGQKIAFDLGFGDLMNGMTTKKKKKKKKIYINTKLYLMYISLLDTR